MKVVGTLRVPWGRHSCLSRQTVVVQFEPVTSARFDSGTNSWLGPAPQGRQTVAGGVSRRKGRPRVSEPRRGVTKRLLVPPLRGFGVLRFTNRRLTPPATACRRFAAPLLPRRCACGYFSANSPTTWQ